MKKFGIVCLLFIIAGSLSAQDAIFASLGVETNANTRESAAFGGGLTSAMDLNEMFSVGVKISFSAALDTVNTLDTAALFRYYLPLKFSGLFVQAELGGAFYFYDGGNYPAFLGGVTAGWRYNVADHWYLEPFVRGGYPFIYGIGLSAGTSFDL